ncbi:hypothetical protein PENTCL1PPCAC_20601, partial [Pristionchus entomophagus]
QEMERRKSRDAHHLEEESDESEEAVDIDDTETEMITQQIHEQTFQSMSGGLLAILSRNKCATFVVLFIGLLRGIAGPLFALRFLFIFGTLEDDDYQS